MGSDIIRAEKGAIKNGFRFTLPVWGATREKPAIPLIQAILIPAPCTGSNLGDFPLELCQQI